MLNLKDVMSSKKKNVRLSAGHCMINFYDKRLKDWSPIIFFMHPVIVMKDKRWIKINIFFKYLKMGVVKTN